MMDGSQSQKKLSFTFLLLLTLGALYLSFLIARPFLSAIILAALLAVVTYPLFTLLLRYVRKRSAAALLATLVILLGLILPTIFVVNTIADEMKALYGWLNEQASDGSGWEGLLTRFTNPPARWIEQKTGISRQEVRRAALGRLQDVSTSLLNWAKSLAVNITGTVIDTFIMLLTLFYFLRDGPAIISRAGSILPLERDRYNELLETISDSMLANFYAVIAVGLVQSVLGAIGYWIAGLPNVALWTVMTARFSPIPMAGAGAVWGAGVIYLALIGHWGKALFLLAYGAVIISLADNVVRPLVVSGRVKLNALLVFFSILGGAQTFGIVGLFVGPIIVSLAIALLRIVTQERSRWEYSYDGGKSRQQD
jgi:predicted PurR-regulated permease PerM